MVLAPQVALAKGLGWDYTPGGRNVPECGHCAWCRTPDVELCSVLPSEFSQWKFIHISPAWPWMCRWCAAAIGHTKPIKWGNVEVRDDATAVMTVDPRDLRRWLDEPVDSDRCVVVPTNRQKRPILSAQWGAVATSYDGVAIPWGDHDVELIRIHDTLRWDYGVSEQEILEDAPRVQTLAKAESDASAVVEMFRTIKQWDALHLEVSCLATRRTEQKGKGG